MNRTLYTLSLYLISPLIWLYFGYRSLKDRRYLQGLRQRLGLIRQISGNRCFHIHCASVGETLAAIPLIDRILADFTEIQILLTTTTPTGKQEVDKIIRSRKSSSISHVYLPIDWPGAVKRFIKRTNPVISILMETELWPNLIFQLSQNKIPILLANARLSSKSRKSYGKHPKLSQQLFSNLSMIAAQFQSDADEFAQLGVALTKIKLVGNLKFEIKIAKKLKQQQIEFKSHWISNRPVWIAASIHPFEFELILNTHRSLLEKIPNLLLIAVPRHPEAFDQMTSLCHQYDFNYLNRSDNRPPSGDEQVFIGDSMGELTMMCGTSNIAFVGGSLIDRGGHNPLEPAVCGNAVIMGDSFYNFSDVCRIMKQYEVIDIIKNQSELETCILSLLSNKKLLEERAKNISNLFARNSGASTKLSLMIKELVIKTETI